MFQKADSIMFFSSVKEIRMADGRFLIDTPKQNTFNLKSGDQVGLGEKYAAGCCLGLAEDPLFPPFHAGNRWRKGAGIDQDRGEPVFPVRQSENGNHGACCNQNPDLVINGRVHPDNGDLFEKQSNQPLEMFPVFRIKAAIKSDFLRQCQIKSGRQGAS